jgi:hypothetical protein
VGIPRNRLIMNCCLEAIVGSSFQSKGNVIDELLKNFFTSSGVAMIFKPDLALQIY